MPSQTRPKGQRTLLAGCVLAALAAVHVAASDNLLVQSNRRILATADFTLTGLAVNIAPAHQTLPRHTATVIHTSLTGVDGDASAILSQLDPDYRVRGQLIGPSLTSPLDLECPIGAPLPIPPLSLPGDHLITNLRVVDTGVAGSPTVAEVMPDTCSLSVFDQLLVSQVQVRELTYDEILASGINVSQDSYSYYNFTLALGTDSDGYKISIPVAMPSKPGDPPIAGPPQSSAKVGTTAPLADVMPLFLELEEPSSNGAPELEGGKLRIPGLIVFPGRLALLHQFFEAILIVSNGAPAHTPLVVHTLSARIELPQAPNPLDNPLRVAALQVGGPVEELELHALGPDGTYGTQDDSSRFAPGESGQASFLIEGLKEGLHTIKFKLQGTLDGLPSGPVQVRGEATGTVRVRDASFAVSFTHPGVVRAAQEYDLGITLFNSGSRDILGAYADLSPLRIAGAELADPTEGNQRSFPSTIKPGESGTVTWRLRSRVTGAVTASFTKVEGATETCLELVTGVGDRNVPLSPDSLILPDAVRYLPPPVVEASSALLGQAWSVATAPSGTLPEGVLPIPRQSVFDRAIELGVAGLRVRFGEPVQVALVTLLRDWLGETQEKPDLGFVETLCSTRTGFSWQDQLGEQLSLVLGAEPPTAFHQAIAEGELARSRFLSILVAHPEAAPCVGVRLVDPQGRSFGQTGPQDRFGSVPAGSMLRLATGFDGQTTSRGAFLLASAPASGLWTLELSAWQPGVVDISILLPVGDDLYRQISFSGVSLAAANTYRIRFDPNSSSSAVFERCVSGTCSPFSASAAVDYLQEAPPRLIAALQVGPAVMEAGDRFGRTVALLFSKPVSPESAENDANYSMGDGTLLGSNPPVSLGTAPEVLGAKLNFSNRFAFLRLSAPIGPFIRRTISLAGVTDALGLTLSPSVTDRPIEITVSPGGAPPGGYLTGRVLNADGTPVMGANVDLYDWPCGGLVPVKIAGVKTDTAGKYAFDYVVDGECSPLTATSTHPTARSLKDFPIPVVYHGQHLSVDFVFLARGNIRGEITLDGQPVSGAQVQIMSNSDPTVCQLALADSTGKYSAVDIPVGGVSVLAVGPEGQTNATGFGAGWIDGPGKTATVDVALQSISGSVEGQVRGPDGQPVSRMLVIAETHIPGFDDPVTLGYCYTASDGSFVLSKLPVTRVTVFATDYDTRLKVAQEIELTSQAPSVTGIALMLPGYGSVSGRVVDQAGYYLPMAEVRCGFAVVTADPFGYYRLPMIVAGTHNIVAVNAVTGLPGSTSVTVWAGQETTNADIVISAAATIKGTVSIVRAPGLPAVPLSGVKVSYDGLKIVTTNSQGAYVLPNVSPGESFVLRFVDPTGRLGVNQPVRLNPSETLIRNVTFHPATIGGKIFQPDGQTGAVALIRIYVPRPILTEGRFFGLLDAESPITTVSEGNGTYLVGNLNPGGFRVLAANDLFPTVVGRLGVLPPDGLVTCNLTLIDTLAGTIKGRVFRPDGVTPAGEGIQVTLGGGHLAEAMIRTGSDGFYSFPEVFASGIYHLTATDPVSGYSNRARISVIQNQDAITDIRLLGRGAIRVRVIDAAGSPVESGSVAVTGLDYPNSASQAVLTPGSGGAVLFEDLPEGQYAVTASRQGLSGRISASIPLSDVVEVTVQLQASGIVTGRVLLPDGSTPVGLADVRLILAGKILGYTLTSDEGDNVGSFSFPDVPIGDFKLEAFDNRSTRVGRTAGRLTQNGETASASIVLISIGTVRGRITANNAPVDHAYVTLESGELGFSHTKLHATTDAAGNYSFPGVPVGAFTLQVIHQASGLTGSGEGLIHDGPEPLPDKIVNITLEQSASLQGVVLNHLGDPVTGARVTVTIGARTLTSTSRTGGVFRLDYVPLGEATVSAQAPSGCDRGRTGPVTITQPGSTVPVEVKFDGVGSVQGDAFDSDGVTPLTLGTVTLTNAEWALPVILACPVTQGKYEIRGAPAGSLSLKLTVPNRAAVGVAAATLEADQTLNIPLKLDPAGSVTGKVVRPDGTTPAVGADVTLRVTRTGGGTFTYTAHTDAAGVYRLDQVLLGTIDIAVKLYEGDGLATIGGLSLSNNGEVLQVPLLVLDESPIEVQSISPANGSTGVSRSTAVTVTFTEPAKTSTVNGSSFKLMRGPAEVISNITLSADGLVATLTPTQILPDNATFTVLVTTQVTDLVGRQLSAEFRSTFTTPDETPPVVTSIDPGWMATNVALDAVVEVTFSEPLDPQQSFAGVVRLYPVGQPQALVPLVISIDESELTITAKPSVALDESTQYWIEVTGQKDLAGNIQTAVRSSVFGTVDQTKPVISLASIEGQTLFTTTPHLSIGYEDNFSGIDATTLLLRLDGQDITAGAHVWEYGATYQVPVSASLARGSHTIEAQISDKAGNQCDLESASFSVDDVPPLINSFNIDGLPAFDGMMVTIFRPTFAATYSDNGMVDVSATKLRLGLEGQPLVEVPASIDFTGLAYQPAADLEQGLYAIELVVTDQLGNSTTAAIRFLIDVDGPQITAFAPLTGNQHGGTTVILTGKGLLNSNGQEPQVWIGGVEAWVIAATAGTPDQVTLVTPPGAPGFANIKITTDRGTGNLPAAFLYETDPQTPFAVEPDTVLLWHLDEPSEWLWSAQDSGPFDIDPDPYSKNPVVPARFGFGQSGAVWGYTGSQALNFGRSSLTLDCWFKSSPVTRTYLLAGKQLDTTGYGISLLPSGSLQGWLQDEAGVQWIAETPPGWFVTDDLWHSASLVVDRENHKLVIFIDGVAESETPEPAGFGKIGDEDDDGYLYQEIVIGEGDYRDTVNLGPWAFPGIIDEVRFSSTAHTADQIRHVFLGDPPLSVFGARPQILMAGTDSEIVLDGYQLSHAQATLVDSAGVVHTAQRLTSSATQAKSKLSLPPSAAAGLAQLQVQSPVGTATFPIRILNPERSLLRQEADTLLLWHLDETQDGAVALMDSGPFSLNGNGSSSSRSLTGQFGHARDAGASGPSPDFSTSSFTVEGWVKDAALSTSGLWFGNDYEGLGVNLHDTAGTWLPLFIPPNQYDESSREWTRAIVSDGQWHFIAVTVDRAVGRVKFYLDGRHVGDKPLPPDFGALRYSHTNLSLSRPWDELRISSRAHTSEEIWQDFAGEHSFDVAAVNPRLIERGLGGVSTQNLVLEGFELGQVSCRLEQGNQPADASVTVTESSYGRAAVSVSTNPGIQLGPAQLVVSSPGCSDRTLDLTVVEQPSPFPVDAHTLLLWKLDETANGSTVILDSGPLGLNGTSVSESKAVEGRFQGGREKAHIDGGRETLLAFDNSSFSIDFWVKTAPVPYRYTLVDRQSNDGSYHEDFSIAILPSGSLEAQVLDRNETKWQVVTQRLKYGAESGWTRCVVDDSRWHSVTVVVDRVAGLLSIYVDGWLKASAPSPSGFGSVGRPSWGELRTGYLTGNMWSTSNSFPGVLDDIRISCTARSSAEVWQEFSGVGASRVTRVLPSTALRDRTAPVTSELTLSGFGLQGLTARLTRAEDPIPGTTVSVSDFSTRSARILVTVPPEVALGPATLVLESQGQELARLPIDVIEPGPFSREADTVALWRLDEAAAGAARLTDSGLFATHGTADSASASGEGRFGGGRSRANFQADDDFGSADFGVSSFTLECWVKTGPIPRAYILVGKSSTYGNGPRFKLVLLPGGRLRAWLIDTGGRQWQVGAEPVVTGPSADRSIKPICDDRWHMVTMVVDRVAGILRLFVDGIERAASPMPAGFLSPPTGYQLRAGVLDPSEPGPLAIQFPGLLDEIRISSTAHTAEKIALDYLGYDDPAITAVSPSAVARDTVDFPVTLHGYGLSGGTVQVDDPSISISSAVARSAGVDIRLSVPAGRPAGPARLTVTDPCGRSCSTDLIITAPQLFANVSPTDNEELVLWHLDETGSGAIPLVGSGDPIPSVIGATPAASSLPAAGRFGGGRTLANLVASAGFGALEPGAGSFSLDCWFNTRPVGRPYNLVGRSGVDGSGPEFALTIMPSGALQASVWDAANRQWKAEMKATAYDQATGTWTTCVIDDSQWHLATMVLDRTAAQLLLYVDGELRASAAPPAGFTTLRNYNQRVRAGLRNIPIGGYFFPDSDQFPGVLDEIRILRHARSASEIGADFGWAMTLPSSSWLKTPGVQPAKDPEPRGANRPEREFQSGAQPFENLEQAGNETILLWHLDEHANGAVGILGAGDPVPAVIDAVASSASIAEEGRFAGGRTSAGIVADPDNGALDFGASSFTVEFWLRTDPVFATYTLAGRDGPLGEAKDFGVSVLPSGRLRAWLFDNAGLEWSSESDILVDDSRWRLITMSVDREAGWLYLLVDDEPVSAVPCPAGFGDLRNQGQPFRAGHLDVGGPVSYSAAPHEFPGVLDEMRILNYARKAEESTK